MAARNFDPSHDSEKLADYKARKDAELDAFYENVAKKTAPEKERRAACCREFAEFVASHITDWDATFEDNGIDAEKLAIEFAGRSDYSVQEIENSASFSDTYNDFNDAADIRLHL